MKKILLLLSGAFVIAVWSIRIYLVTPEQSPIKTVNSFQAPSQPLSPASRVDDLDLEETMKIIGRALREIKSAKNTKEMIAPAKVMAQYASQAEMIGLIGANAQLQQQYVDEIQRLRQEIFKLQQIIHTEDLVMVKEQIKILDQIRREGHRRFKNY